MIEINFNQKWLVLPSGNFLIYRVYITLTFVCDILPPNFFAIKREGQASDFYALFRGLGRFFPWSMPALSLSFAIIGFYKYHFFVNY